MSVLTEQIENNDADRKHRINEIVTKASDRLLRMMVRQKRKFDPDLVIASYFELKSRGTHV